MKALQNLRTQMQAADIAACIIPSNDPHASEYVAKHWQARRYFSGFTGSAGTLLVLPDEAGFWTDSRYFLQAEEQLQGISLFREGEADVPKIYEYLMEKLPENSVVSMNGWLFSVAEIEEAEAAFAKRNIRIDTQTDLIAQTWDERPPLPFSEIFIHETKFSGKMLAEKLQLVRQEMQQNDCDALFLNALDEIAWLLNLRASDVEYNPVFIGYAIVKIDEIILFVDEKKLSEEVQKYLQNNNIRIENYELVAEKKHFSGKNKIWIDPNRMNWAIYEKINSENEIFRAPSPVILLKSIKNSTEINGMRQAMEKDGVALTHFWRWLENALANNETPTELSIAEKLRSFRAKQDLFFGESFAPIVAYGAHGAIVHYSATEATNAVVRPAGFLLLDSGGQYLHGTTDITRTFALGSLTDEQKRHYTLVLKGHIALAQAVFPVGTCGYQLDAFARQFLWREGLNYGHGTGHGVGCFLCVHEPPQNIRPNANPTPLQAGMVISNEPGIYFAEKYGIRLENLVLVQENNKNGFLSFETLTLFPFDSNAIDFQLLTSDETTWLKQYHQTVFERLLSRLDAEAAEWLAGKISPFTQ